MASTSGTASGPEVYDKTYRATFGPSLVANTIMNVTTQDAQLAVFANAVRHLEPGGVLSGGGDRPQLRRVPPGETARVFTLDPDHVGIETFDDVAGQIAWSHHWIEADGRLVRHSAPYRYLWPSGLELMARITGFRRFVACSWCHVLGLAVAAGADSFPGRDRGADLVYPAGPGR